MFKDTRSSETMFYKISLMGQIQKMLNKKPSMYKSSEKRSLIVLYGSCRIKNDSDPSIEISNFQFKTKCYTRSTTDEEDMTVCKQGRIHLLAVIAIAQVRRRNTKKLLIMNWAIGHKLSTTRVRTFAGSLYVNVQYVKL